MTSDDIPLNYSVLERKMMTAEKTAHSSPIAEPCKNRVCRQTRGDLNLFFARQSEREEEGCENKGQCKVADLQIILRLVFQWQAKVSLLGLPLWFHHLCFI